MSAHPYVLRVPRQEGCAVSLPPLFFWLQGLNHRLMPILRSDLGESCKAKCHFSISI